MARPEDCILLIGVGYEKCGTTTVARTLERDKRFAVPANKELFFFNQNYSPNAKEYFSKFPMSPTTEYLVDFTPSYIRSSEAIARIQAFDAEKRIVVCVRDPIQRAYSNYIHNIFYHEAHYDPVLKKYARSSLYEAPFALTFEEALSREVGAIRSVYRHELQQVYDAFGEKNVLVLVLERDFQSDIFNEKMSQFLGMSVAYQEIPRENTGGRLPMILSPDEEMRLSNGRASIELRPGNVYIFLSEKQGIAVWENVPDYAISRIIDASHHWSSYVAPAKTRELRDEYFGEDIKQIEQLIGTKLPEWRKELALEAHRWFGVGPLKQHKPGVHAAISIFGVNPIHHPFA